MRLHYDAETDSLYIKVAERPAADSDEILPGIVADLDSEGRLVGLDVQHASLAFDLNEVELDGLPARLLAKAAVSPSAKSPAG